VESEHQFGRSIAVIGSGVAGLTAAYALSRQGPVTLFEADTRLGGHAHTHYVDDGDGNVIGIDSAFLVHNDRTYPTLCRLFDDLGIATRDTDMSMSVRTMTPGWNTPVPAASAGCFRRCRRWPGRATC
jgi:predicted NAD/FAD-binding protein